jgi:hypothetical protein
MRHLGVALPPSPRDQPSLGSCCAGLISRHKGRGLIRAALHAHDAVWVYLGAAYKPRASQPRICLIARWRWFTGCTC